MSIAGSGEVEVRAQSEGSGVRSPVPVRSALQGPADQRGSRVPVRGEPVWELIPAMKTRLKRPQGLFHQAAAIRLPASIPGRLAPRWLA